jgi:hypothetical protein
VLVKVEGRWERWGYDVVSRSLAQDIAVAVALDGERQERNGWQRRKRMREAFDAMVARHPGELLRWARFSMPGAEEPAPLRSAWKVYSRWWRRNHGPMDYQAVIDRGPIGEHVWHLHVAYFGAFVDQVELARAWARAGGPEFVYVRSARAGQARYYLGKRIVGYLEDKNKGRRMAGRWL